MGSSLSTIIGFKELILNQYALLMHLYINPMVLSLNTHLNMHSTVVQIYWNKSRSTKIYAVVVHVI